MIVRPVLGDKPKKPANAYTRFSRIRWKQLGQEQEEAAAGAAHDRAEVHERNKRINKRIGEEWRVLPDDQKEPYLQQYQA